MDIKYEDLVAFHGHSCPGLAIGYRMTKAALSFLADRGVKDGELVAITENDSCGVDALQCLSGCTFGKDNLIFEDYGKNAYTLFDRKSGKGIRVVFTPRNIPDKIREDRHQLINWLRSVPEKEIVILQKVHSDAPEPAGIVPAVECEYCKEHAIETKTRKIDGKVACIPCTDKHLKKSNP